MQARRRGTGRAPPGPHRFETPRPVCWHPSRGEVRLVTVKARGEQIGALMSEGKVEAVVERTCPITEIAAAHTQSATGRVRGKIAIAVP